MGCLNLYSWCPTPSPVRQGGSLHSHLFSGDRRASPSGLLYNPLCRLSSSQIESMMLKLQRLQQKAILDDDYDAGELQTFRLLRVALWFLSRSCHFLLMCLFCYGNIGQFDHFKNVKDVVSHVRERKIAQQRGIMERKDSVASLNRVEWLSWLHSCSSARCLYFHEAPYWKSASSFY